MGLWRVSCSAEMCGGMGLCLAGWQRGGRGRRAGLLPALQVGRLTRGMLGMLEPNVLPQTELHPLPGMPSVGNHPLSACRHVLVDEFQVGEFPELGASSDLGLAALGLPHALYNRRSGALRVGQSKERGVEQRMVLGCSAWRR